jgi:hypothetical protein
MGLISKSDNDEHDYRVRKPVEMELVKTLFTNKGYYLIPRFDENKRKEATKEMNLRLNAETQTSNEPYVLWSKSILPSSNIIFRLIDRFRERKKHYFVHQF